MPASYPTSTPSFPTKANNVDTYDASHINSLQDEVVAIAGDLRAGLPVARGGTGATSAPTALTNLGALPLAGGTMTGALTVNGQIVFPGTQNASSNANTLDDYEEGTWTPIIGGGTSQTGQSYTHQYGRYVKVGKLVTAHFDVLLSNKGTITGAVQLKGLPFSSVAGTSGVDVGTGAIGYFAGMATNWTDLSGHVSGGSTAVVMYGVSAAAAAATALAAADIGNTTRWSGTVTYEATA